MENFGISIIGLIVLTMLGTGISIFLIWRWFFKKFIGLPRTRGIAAWTMTIMTTPILYVAIIMAVVVSISYYPRHKFDQTGWLSGKDRRYEYTENIINSHMLIGKTKSEVLKILGDDGNSQQSDLWYYGLGNKPGIFNTDPSLLEITFGNGEVVALKEI